MFFNAFVLPISLSLFPVFINVLHGFNTAVVWVYTEPFSDSKHIHCPNRWGLPNELSAHFIRGSWFEIQILAKSNQRLKYWCMSVTSLGFGNIQIGRGVLKSGRPIFCDWNSPPPPKISYGTISCLKLAKSIVAWFVMVVSQAIIFLH